MHNKLLPILVAGLVFAACCAPFKAVAATNISDVPLELPQKVRYSLGQRKSALLMQRSELKDRMTRQKQKCTKINKNDSGLIDWCKSEGVQIEAEIVKFKGALADYERDLRTEINRNKASTKLAKSADRPHLRLNDWKPIDPGWLAMPNQGDISRAQLANLNNEQIGLEERRKRCEEEEKKTQGLILENVQATKDLMHDTESQAVSVVGTLLAMSALPAKAVQGIALAMPAIQGYYAYRGYSDANEEQRAHAKMVEGIGELKNFALSVPKVLPGKEGEQVKAATDATLKIYEIVERHSSKGLDSKTIRADMENLSGAAVDLGHIVAPKNSAGAVKLGVGYAEMAMMPRALYELDKSRAELEWALNQNATATKYYEHRLEGVRGSIEFWESELAKSERPK